MKRLINITEGGLTTPKTIHIPLDGTYILERVYISISPVETFVKMRLSNSLITLSGFTNLSLFVKTSFIVIDILPYNDPIKGTLPANCNILFVLKKEVEDGGIQEGTGGVKGGGEKSS